MGEILRKSSRREGICLFRGEPVCYPIVSSSLYRNCPDCRNEAFDIAALEKEIVQRARAYTNVTDDDEILAEIQHFGGSTNLLDFTDDYLVALFFASADRQEEHGRVVLHWPNSKAVVRAEANEQPGRFSEERVHSSSKRVHRPGRCRRDSRRPSLPQEKHPRVPGTVSRHFREEHLQRHTRIYQTPKPEPEPLRGGVARDPSETAA